MAEPVTIAVDVMGGDRGPAVVLRGAPAGAGPIPTEAHARRAGRGRWSPSPPLTIGRRRRRATGVIRDGEHPAGAVRAKKDSSIVVGCRLVKRGRRRRLLLRRLHRRLPGRRHLVVGRIKGVKRPPWARSFPAWARPTLLIDVGPMPTAKPEYLVQFAQMGEVYMNAIMGVEHPEGRSSEHRRGGHQGRPVRPGGPRLLTEAVPAFAGNCEGATSWRATSTWWSPTGSPAMFA